MRRWAPALAAFALAAPAALSDALFEEKALAAAPDLAYGEYLASECLTCHRTSGAGEGIPVISGWPRDAFIHALATYRSGYRTHQVMEMVARGMGPDEAASIAAYFETLTQ